MITNYSTLQDAVADWLNRGDLSGAIPTFIQLAERKFQRDPRCRRQVMDAAFEIDAGTVNLPGRIMSVDSWAHDGPVYGGPIFTVGAEQIPQLKIAHGEFGPPRFVAIINGKTAIFAPEPDGPYPTRLTYWESIEPLNDGDPTNWLLEEHPDIYLYGALVESAPYLKDDPRVVVWQAQLESRLNELHLSSWNAQWSGSMRPTIRPIG